MSLTNSESESSPKNNLKTRRAGLSSLNVQQLDWAGPGGTTLMDTRAASNNVENPDSKEHQCYPRRYHQGIGNHKIQDNRLLRAQKGKCPKFPEHNPKKSLLANQKIPDVMRVRRCRGCTVQ